MDDRLGEILDELRPDAIVEDNVVCFPASHHSGRPWEQIVSCNPLELKDSALPPVFSGYARADQNGWDEFRAEYRRTIAELHAEFSAFCAERGAPPLPEEEFVHEPGWLNLYLHPAEVDNSRSRPLAPTWHDLETCVRRVDAAPLPAVLPLADAAIMHDGNNTTTECLHFGKPMVVRMAL